MERSLSLGTIDRKLDHLNKTKDFLKSENLNVTDIERQISVFHEILISKM